MVDAPVIITGCGRSGTTLLFDVLTNHPQLVRTEGYPDGEDHVGWIDHGGAVMAGIGNVSHTEYGTGINGELFCLHQDDKDVTREIRVSMQKYHWEEVLKRRAGFRVLNKTPHLANKLRYVLGIFPNAKIIHIVRDCEPTVASWMAMMSSHPTLSIYWPRCEQYPCLWLMPRPKTLAGALKLQGRDDFYPGGSGTLFVDYWVETNKNIELQMRDQLRSLLTIRYEDFIASPSALLSRICEFAGLDTNHNFLLPKIESATHEKYSKLVTPEIKSYIRQRAAGQLARHGYTYGT
jgi:hypothetical protein